MNRRPVIWAVIFIICMATTAAAVSTMEAYDEENYFAVPGYRSHTRVAYDLHVVASGQDAWSVPGYYELSIEGPQTLNTPEGPLESLYRLSHAERMGDLPLSLRSGTYFAGQDDFVGDVASTYWATPTKGPNILTTRQYEVWRSLPEDPGGAPANWSHEWSNSSWWGGSPGYGPVSWSLPADHVLYTATGGMDFVIFLADLYGEDRRYDEAEYHGEIGGQAVLGVRYPYERAAMGDSVLCSFQSLTTEFRYQEPGASPFSRWGVSWFAPDSPWPVREECRAEYTDAGGAHRTLWAALDRATLEQSGDVVTFPNSGQDVREGIAVKQGAKAPLRTIPADSTGLHYPLAQAYATLVANASLDGLRTFLNGSERVYLERASMRVYDEPRLWRYTGPETLNDDLVRASQDFEEVRDDPAQADDVANRRVNETRNILDDPQEFAEKTQAKANESVRHVKQWAGLENRTAPKPPPGLNIYWYIQLFNDKFQTIYLTTQRDLINGALSSAHDTNGTIGNDSRRYEEFALDLYPTEAFPLERVFEWARSDAGLAFRESSEWELELGLGYRSLVERTNSSVSYSWRPSMTYTVSHREGDHDAGRNHQYSWSAEDGVMESEYDNAYEYVPKSEAGPDVHTSSSNAQPTTMRDPASALGASLGAVLLAFAVAYVWSPVKAALSATVAYPLYAKISKDKVLRHKKREEIVQLVDRNPGISLAEVRRKLGLGWGTTVHHLTTLERNQYVTSVRSGTERRFFIPGQVDHNKLGAAALLHSGAAARLWRLVRERPRISQREAAKELGLSHATVFFHAQRLAKANLLRTERDGRSVRYHADDLGLAMKPDSFPAAVTWTVGAQAVPVPTTPVIPPRAPPPLPAAASSSGVSEVA